MKLPTLIISLALIIASSGNPSAQAHYQEPKVPVSQFKVLSELHTTPLKPLLHLDLAPLPSASQGTYSNLYEPLNCTWYVASRKNVPQNWGDAKNWAPRAASAGYTVTDQPVVGAIAQKDGGLYGHVALVVGVSNGQVLISEMNVDGLGIVDERLYPVSDFRYIYA